MAMSLTQNKKIAITAVALFMLSFTFMLFFLENGDINIDEGHADILAANSHSGEVETRDSTDSYYKSFLPERSVSPFFVTNAEGVITYSSDDFCELLSVSCEDLSDKTMFDYINSKDLSDTFSNHTKLLQNGEPIEALGPYRMIKDEDEVLLLLSAYPILDDDNKVSEIVFSVKDLTDKVEEMNGEDKNNERDQEDKDNWIYDLYPKVQELNDKTDVRMMVDKISFNVNE